MKGDCKLKGPELDGSMTELTRIGKVEMGEALQPGETLETRACHLGI